MPAIIFFRFLDDFIRNISIPLYLDGIEFIVEKIEKVYEYLKEFSEL